MYLRTLLLLYAQVGWRGTDLPHQRTHTIRWPFTRHPQTPRIPSHPHLSYSLSLFRSLSSLFRFRSASPAKPLPAHWRLVRLRRPRFALARRSKAFFSLVDVACLSACRPKERHGTRTTTTTSTYFASSRSCGYHLLTDRPNTVESIRSRSCSWSCQFAFISLRTAASEDVGALAPNSLTTAAIRTISTWPARVV